MNLSRLHKDILEECSIEDEGLWNVITAVTREIISQQVGAAFYSPPGGIWTQERQDQLIELTNAIDPKKLQQQTLDILHDLLDAGLIVAGMLGEEGEWIGTGWELPPAVIITRIRTEWEALGHQPTIGDIVWFKSTAQGDRILHEGKERNVL
jgi:hypothetical protein